MFSQGIKSYVPVHDVLKMLLLSSRTRLSSSTFRRVFKTTAELLTSPEQRRAKFTSWLLLWRWMDSRWSRLRSCWQSPWGRAAYQCTAWCRTLWRGSSPHSGAYFTRSQQISLLLLTTVTLYLSFLRFPLFCALSLFPV